jgi:hypothetical protein
VKKILLEFISNLDAKKPLERVYVAVVGVVHGD